MSSAPRTTPFPTYKSPYGPKYKISTNYHGITLKEATKLGTKLGAFGGMAGFFALFFFSDIPRVRNDIWLKVPFIREHFVKDIPASDNVTRIQ